MRGTSCLTCSVLACDGMKFNSYTNSWVCPVFNVGVPDNKTIIVNGGTGFTNISTLYGCDSSDGTGSKED